MTTRPRAAIFGAGAIGRGLVGWLFGRAGWRIVFVDISPDLVDLLNRRGSYRVIPAGRSERAIDLITGVQAVNGADTARAAAVAASSHLVCTAVGPGALRHLAPTLAAALARKDCRIGNVIACENSDPNTGLLRSHVVSVASGPPRGVGFPETLVDRVAPGGDPGGLDVEVESRFEFKVAADGWRGEPPEVAGLELVDDLAIHRSRKLWLVNGLHAAAAFLGSHAGHDTIAEAVSDLSIRAQLEEMVETMAAVLRSESRRWDSRQLAAYGHSNLERFASPALVDPIRRVARHPLRKLGPGERLVGPARRAARLGLPAGALCDAIAAGLTLTDRQIPGVPELIGVSGAEGWRSVVGLTDPDERLIGMLQDRVERSSSVTRPMMGADAQRPG